MKFILFTLNFILVGLIYSPALAGFAADYYNAALQGDLSQVETAFASEEIDQKDQALYSKFKARFIDKTDGLDVDAIGDPLVRGAALLYQDYWRGALLNPSTRESLEQALLANVVILLGANGENVEGLSEEDALNRLEAAIKVHGFELILGRTQPLLEFMVWRKNELTTYQVELTDRIQPVNVYFMTGFISFGWTHFATFGRSSTGGWTTNDGLYAVKDSYEPDSENFQVSYLKHEARHFADYQLFPNLAGPDLEYRAKLTELCFAVTDLQELLEAFTANAARVANAPHSLANWYVVDGLARLLLSGRWPEIEDVWEGLDGEGIHAAARTLLDENTKALQKDGAATTIGVLHP